MRSRLLLLLVRVLLLVIVRVLCVLLRLRPLPPRRLQRVPQRVRPAPFAVVVLPLGVILLSMLSLAKPYPIETSIKRIAIVAFGVLYCCALFPFLGALRSLDQGLQLSVIALFCTWGGDTAAYFSGLTF